MDKVILISHGTEAAVNNNINIFYHASSIGGLHELLPLSKMHGGEKTVCYFTPDRTYALFYLRDMKINHVTCGLDGSGVVAYHEQFPSQLAKIYGGRSGYIYSCASGGLVKQGHTGGVWIAAGPVPVLESEFIKDVYAEIIKAEQNGLVKIIRYEELPDEKKNEIAEMMKNYILKNNLLHIDTKKSRFFKNNFPDSWQAAETVIHYDALVDENNDPFHDPEPLKAYMDKWDGEAFIEALRLAPDKSVLEIGVGTGRLAVRVCDKCRNFTGIDISPKTVEKAKLNLRNFPNARLICGDFLTYPFPESYDAVYSSLTFLHIKDKLSAIQKAASLLTPGGRFVLSIDKNRQDEIDFGNRKITVYPDTPEEINLLLTGAGLTIEKQFETEFACVFAARKG